MIWRARGRPSPPSSRFRSRSHRRSPGTLAPGREGVALWGQRSPRDTTYLHGTRRPVAVQGRERCAGRIRSRPGEPTEDNKAFHVGNGAYRIDFRSRGCLPEQPQQGIGRASVRPIRPSAQAASLATSRSVSSSSSGSRGMAAGDHRAQRQPPARIPARRADMSSIRWGSSLGDAGPMWISIVKIWPTSGLSAGALEGSGRPPAP
jgi:hypothetical protein